MAQAALVSGAERQFIADGVAQDLRNDGRRRDEPRIFRVETGVVPQATGSAKLMLGNTHVIACVKAEIGSPLPGRPDEGRLEIAVDCSPTAAPEFQGRGGEELQAELASALHSSLMGRTAGHKDRLVGTGGGGSAGAPGAGGEDTDQGEPASVGVPHTSALDLGRLVLAPGKTCWVLYLDALVLSMDGNLLGAISLALKAALRDVMLPRVEVVMGDDGEAPELEIVEEGEGEGSRLDVSQVPLIVQLAQIGQHFVADATAEEEAVAVAGVWASMRADGRVTSARQNGPRGVAPSMLSEMLLAAAQTSKTWHARSEEGLRRAELLQSAD